MHSWTSSVVITVSINFFRGAQSCGQYLLYLLRISRIRGEGKGLSTLDFVHIRALIGVRLRTTTGM